MVGWWVCCRPFRANELEEIAMKTKRALFYCLAALLGGCVPIVSLHPLFTGEDIVFEEKLLGTWGDDVNEPEVTWEFARFEEGDTEALPETLDDQIERLYRLRLTDDDGHEGSFVATLVRLNGRRFLDIFPDEFPSGEPDVEKMKLVYNAFFFLRVHTFARVDTIGKRLQMRLTDDEEFAELLEAEPNAVRHEVVEDRPVLTAGTKELQAFVLKLADDERLFPNEVVLQRREP